MSRLTITVPDEFRDRLQYFADHYDMTLQALSRNLLVNALALLEDAIACEACAQITYLVNAEPAGNA